MSDIQSDAAPNSTEPSVPAASVEEGKPIESGSTVESTPSADTSIPSGSEISSAGDAGNTVEAGSATSGEIVAVPAADVPADTSAMTSAIAAVSGEIPDAADLPRESHLMLLEHKLAAMHAKFMTGERIVIDEFEQILGHIRAVL